MRVTILDIEPIEPAHGGSRLRLMGLYHGLGEEIEALYVGAFHWPGPVFRRLRHGPNFEEITVPFSEQHFAAAESLQASMNGETLIDASFPRLGSLSEDFCSYARQAAVQADVVVFSHPWVYAIAADVIRREQQLLVYDAHNVESKLRWHLLNATPEGRNIAREVEALEGELCRSADFVVACSHRDRTLFIQTYGIDAARTRVCPNGVFANRIKPADRHSRSAARAEFGLGDESVALFIGGRYPPNIEAASFICNNVARASPALTFIVVGDAGVALIEDDIAATLPKNVRIVGPVDDDTKLRWLHAADLGINPMFSGEGTNIKMFDYMAAGLPVVTTPVGARGIEGEGAFSTVEQVQFAEHLNSVAVNRPLRAELASRGRSLVEREFDWANISAELGAVILRAGQKRCPAPYFSVTIPTLDRPQKLRRLLDLLAVQHERDFEVVVVDQSSEIFDAADFGIDLVLLHSPIRGACRARNLAAAVARGRILVFVDDDCEPGDMWLAEARMEFEMSNPVALEGRVISDHLHDSRWRSVHNYGAEGLGFMTCNLFVQAKVFHALGGFDVAFDEHDFRYDTDLGWRLQGVGDVPFSENAFVYHPPWSRAIFRESEAKRNLMFSGDALLLRKHPQQYRKLFLHEGHWRKGCDFWDPFLHGIRRHRVEVPEFVREKMSISGINIHEIEY